MLTDADIETRELAEIGNRAGSLYAQGICAHMGWQVATPTHTPHLRPGQAQCSDCGEVFESEPALLEAAEELLG